MFSRFANPNCGTAFDHRQGQFFRFHNNQDEGRPDPNAHSVQHVWLCDHCRASYSLEYRERAGVLICARSGEPRAHEKDRIIAAA